MSSQFHFFLPFERNVNKKRNMSIFFFLIIIKVDRFIRVYTNKQALLSWYNKKKFSLKQKKCNPDDPIPYLNGQTLVCETAKSNTKKILCCNSFRSITAQSKRCKISNIHSFLKSNR